MTDPDHPAFLRLIKCPSHGNRRWRGHIMCNECGRAFQTTDEKAKRFAPEKCPCGFQLVPPKEEQVGDLLGMTGVPTAEVLATDGGPHEIKLKTYDEVEWSARPICYVCYRKVDKLGGQIPGYAIAKAKEIMKREEGN